MNRVDSPYDRGADSCQTKAAQLAALLLPLLILRTVRRAQRSNGGAR